MKLQNSDSVIKAILKSCAVFGLILMHFAVFAHEGHHNRVAWEACDNKELDVACQFVMQETKLYAGTCKQISNDLMCVRNKPIATLSEKELASLDIQMPKHDDIIKRQEPHSK